MGTSSFVAPSSFMLTQSQQAVRWAALAFAALLLYSGFFGLTKPVSAAQKHGCAPDAPPVIASPVPAQALPGEVIINEVLSQPKSSWNCAEPEGVFSATKDSWIEIYNPQSQPLDLYAARAQISLNGGSTYSLLPFGSAIAPQSFLVIFPLEHLASAPPSTWNVLLSIDGITIDQAAIPPLQPDQSYARVPDGTTTWLYAGTPTIDASNNSTGQPVLPTSSVQTPKATTTPVSSTTAGTGASAPPVSLGTQPAWGQVQFPANPTPTPTVIDTTDQPVQLPNQPSDPTPATNNGPGGGTIALIVLFSLLLLGGLIWCWRLFCTPR